MGVSGSSPPKLEIEYTKMSVRRNKNSQPRGPTPTQHTYINLGLAEPCTDHMCAHILCAIEQTERNHRLEEGEQ